MENNTLRDIYNSQKTSKRGSVFITLLIIAIFLFSAIFYIKTSKPELYNKAVSCVKTVLENRSLETVSDKIYESVTPTGDMLRTADTLDFTYLSSDLKTRLISGDFYSMPLKNANLTSPFGTRTDPVTKAPLSTHHGIDLAAPAGSKIYAFSNGTVTFAGTTSVYGNCVTLRGNTLESFYGHMSSLAVSEGDTVRAGDLIGIIGSTGKSTGTHLHFEIRKNGQRVDPAPYLYEKI